MKHLPELNGLRGLAALYVFLHHTLMILPSAMAGDPLGHFYGVDLFMILSGFNTCCQFEKTGPTYGRFIVGRAFRIFPVYFAGLLASVVLLNFVSQTVADAPASLATSGTLHVAGLTKDSPAAHILAHATLLQGIIPESLLPQVSFSIIPQAWSLSLLWQFYLAMPLILALIATSTRWTSRFGLAAFVLVVVACRNSLGIAFLGNNLLMFALGIATYRLLRHLHNSKNDGFLLAGLVALMGVSTVVDAYTLPTLAVWVTTIYCAVRETRGRVARLISAGLHSRFAQRLGRISYSFYIFHMIALFACLRAIDRAGLPGNLRYIALPLAAFVLTIVFAEIANRFIERPCHRLGKILIAPAAPALAVAA